MARGGKREGAGRKPDPTSKRQQALAKRAAKKADLGRGLTLPSGEKSPDAPPGWPFGTQAAPAAAAEPEVPTDPDSDDGLTHEQRTSMTPLEYLLAVMRSPKASKSARMTAAIQAAPYVHGKIAPGAKKEEAKVRAGKAAAKFATAAPPRLVAVR